MAQSWIDEDRYFFRVFLCLFCLELILLSKMHDFRPRCAQRPVFLGAYMSTRCSNEVNSLHHLEHVNCSFSRDGLLSHQDHYYYIWALYKFTQSVKRFMANDFFYLYGKEKQQSLKLLFTPTNCEFYSLTNLILALLKSWYFGMPVSWECSSEDQAIVLTSLPQSSRDLGTVKGCMP